MTLQQVKDANPGFFAASMTGLFQDTDLEILTDKTGPILRVTSAAGTRPVYRIDPKTLELNYLRHDDEVTVEFES